MEFDSTLVVAAEQGQSSSTRTADGLRRPAPIPPRARGSGAPPPSLNPRQPGAGDDPVPAAAAPLRPPPAFPRPYPRPRVPEQRFQRRRYGSLASNFVDCLIN